MLVSPSSLQAAWKIYLRFVALCQAVRIICGLVHMVCFILVLCIWCPISSLGASGGDCMGASGVVYLTL